MHASLLTADKRLLHARKYVIPILQTQGPGTNIEASNVVSRLDVQTATYLRIWRMVGQREGETGHSTRLLLTGTLPLCLPTVVFLWSMTLGTDHRAAQQNPPPPQELAVFVIKPRLLFTLKWAEAGSLWGEVTVLFRLAPIYVRQIVWSGWPT